MRNKNTITAELDSADNRARNSETLNNIIYNNYKRLFAEVPTNSKNALLKVWTAVINSAGRPRNNATISRIYMDTYRALDPVIKLLYPNENTLVNVFSEFRKPIRDKFGDSEVYRQSQYVLGISRERAIERRQEYDQKVQTLNRDRRQLQVLYDDEIYNVIDTMITSQDPLDRTIAVMLCTGSRFIEVLKVSEYTATDEPRCVRVKGIAKDRAQRGYENKIVTRCMPRLESEDIIDAVIFIRSKLNVSPEMDNKTITGRYNKQINTRVRKAFPNHPWVTSHKLRYMSANLSYLIHGNNGVENTYIQAYLAHESGATSRTYQSINIKLRNAPNPPSDDNKINAEISELKNDLSNLRDTNAVDHDEIKTEIAELQPAPYVLRHNGLRNGNLPIFAELLNPRQKTSKEDKLENLKKIMKKYADINIRPKQDEIKRIYRYGSSILTEFWRTL